MELGKQIKRARELRGLSQDDLAEKIYVSRQTISNWETDRTCPDIHSLLLLSALFDVSVDELLRGDIEVMRKRASDARRMRGWSWVMGVGMVAGVLLVAPCMEYWGNIGIVLPLVLLLAAAIASVILERYKRQNNMQTFSEIVAFLDDSPRDEEKIAKERRHWGLKRALMVLAAGIIGAALALTGILLTRIF